jgi:hypothetical protein
MTSLKLEARGTGRLQLPGLKICPQRPTVMAGKPMNDDLYTWLPDVVY